MRLNSNRGAGKSRLETAAILAATLAIAGTFSIAGRTLADQQASNQLSFSDSNGVHSTITTAGSIDQNNPFFQPLGTNGRTCFTCHRPAQGWTMTPAELQQRFTDTAGLDPVFTTNDGSDCEAADTGTVDERRAAFSLLLSKGLIRIGLPVPDGAEFDIVDVDDPHRCGAPFTEASMYRRPLPATNLRFLSTVMWDGRETLQGKSVKDDLADQALHATTGHEQGAVPSSDQLDAIVDFETSLFTAQSQDRGAGSLSADGALGGPAALSSQPFCIGINDPFGLLPSVPGACGAPSTGLNTNVFTVFTSWEQAVSPAREAIARGERIFNTRTFTIDNVAGLNATPSDPVAGPITAGTCSTCHDTPNAGTHSVALPLNIGVADASRRTPDLPLYTLQNKKTGEMVQTTDPGRAMITGRWADIGKFKGPGLRGLAARAPYFHNGSAATLGDVVDFYDRRFNLGLTAQEKADLVAFLGAL